MKKQKINAKLILKKECIANLDNPSMNQIRGGKNAAASMWFTCSIPRAAC